MKQTHILLGHGSGGRLSHELIRNLFVRHFHNPLLEQQGDAALIDVNSKKLAFTTDSFVVDPLFFPGGDIGKLAVAGTVNDLAVSGAVPKYLSAGFIIEEGFPLEMLEKVVISMAAEAQKAGVLIVTGDTKVVEKGKCDKLFINTAGVGEMIKGAENIATGSTIEAGDIILINGSVGDHGMAVMGARNQLNISAGILSDCACLNQLTEMAIKQTNAIKFMRDATRGGLGTVMAELCEGRNFGIQLFEENIPMKEGVRGMCELLGFDPLYVANEGKVVVVVSPDAAEQLLKLFRAHPLGKEAVIIGEITSAHAGRTWLETSIGGSRIVDMPAGEQLPRIC
ncbi:MAG: hydrogenase expression/formation protein HypE [Bacteroidales bacterium]|nr:hydrogenase expression/formation protein HypE [Bacteroidales bacterium]